MKLNELTKTQRASIEADEVGKEILKLLGYLKEYKLSDIGWGSKWSIQSEIKRTIKRIDNQIEWINSELTGHIQILSETVEDEFDRGYYGCTENIKRDFQIRIRKLKKQKELYELMEKLE